MSTFEMFVVGFHSIVLLVFLAMAIDYAMGFDKLEKINSWVNQLGYDNDSPLTAFLGLEFLCLVMVMFIPIIGWHLALAFIGAITVLYMLVFLLFAVLIVLGFGIEKIREKRLSKKK